MVNPEFMHKDMKGVVNFEYKNNMTNSQQAEKLVSAKEAVQS